MNELMVGRVSYSEFDQSRPAGHNKAPVRSWLKPQSIFMLRERGGTRVTCAPHSSHLCSLLLALVLPSLLLPAPAPTAPCSRCSLSRCSLSRCSLSRCSLSRCSLSRLCSLCSLLPLGFSTALGHFRAHTILYLGFASQRLV